MELKQEIINVVNSLPEESLSKVLEYVHQVEREKVSKEREPLRPSLYIQAILAKHDKLFKRLA